MKPNGRASFLSSLLLAFAGTLGLSSTAAAQDIAAAEALFTRGLADMEAGKYETGCKALAESQRIDPRPGTLFTLATCDDRWGHIATAVTRYGDYLALYDRLPDDRKHQQKDRPKLARAQREKLAPEVPELTVSLAPGAPAGTVVKRDGQVLADAALGMGLPVDPGEHTLSTQAPGGALREQRITMGKGEKKTLTLDVVLPAIAKVDAGEKPPVLETPQATKAETGPSGQRVAAFAVGGIGIAGLAAGGILGGLAMARKGTIGTHCGTAVGAKDPTACDQSGLDAANATKHLALGSTIGFIAGGVATATGLVLLLTEPKPANPTTGARRTWVSAGVLSIGPAGVLAGAQGAW